MTMVLIAAMAVSKCALRRVRSPDRRSSERCVRYEKNKNAGQRPTSLTLLVCLFRWVGFGTQDYISGGVIAALVFLNVGVSTINEYQAEKVSRCCASLSSGRNIQSSPPPLGQQLTHPTLGSRLRSQTVAALEEVGSPTAVVIRQSPKAKGGDGETKTIKTEEVVPCVAFGRSTIQSLLAR